MNNMNMDEIINRANVDKYWSNHITNYEKVIKVNAIYLIDKQHFDIIIKYMYIDAYVQNKDYDRICKIYNEMQEKRIGKSDSKCFNTLIDSFRQYGYLKQFPIPVNENLKILNGSHRLACCFYFNIDPYIEIVDAKEHTYAIDWFLNNGFSMENINEAVLVSKKIINKLYDNKETAINGIIWNAAIDFESEIFEFISFYCEVLEKKKYELGDNYENFVKYVYENDGIPSWKINKKISHMNTFDNKSVILFKLHVKEDYQYDNNMKIIVNRNISEMKKYIREKISPRINNYYYDVIIHLPYNYEENGFLKSAIGRLSEQKNKICLV